MPSTNFASIRSALEWVARLGSDGAARNAKEAVESSARADRLFAELDERARRNGWDRPRRKSA